MRALALVLLAGCIELSPADGKLACAASGKECPDGYTCAADRRCYRAGGPMGGGDLAGADLSGDDMSAAARCDDGVRNGGETDVDCGGPCAQKCALDQGCAGDGDCMSNICNVTTQKCVDSACKNGVRDGSETDVDCGGGDCPKCEPDKGCIAASDCLTDTCGPEKICTLFPLEWSFPTAPNCPREFSSAAADDKRLYNFGGGYACVDSGDPDDALRVEEYDPVSDAWTRRTPWPAPANRGQAASDDGVGRLFVAGGLNDSETSTRNTTRGWDTVAAAWTVLAAMAADRAFHGMARGPGSSLFVAGGHRGDVTLDVNCLSSVEVFTPPALLAAGGGSWAAGPALDVFRCELGMTRGLDGRIYAIGGRTRISSAGTDLAAVEMLAPGGSAWQNAAPLPQARSALVAVGGRDGRIYAMGGRIAGTPTDRVDIYLPAINRWIAGPPLPGAHGGGNGAVGPDWRVYHWGGRGPTMGTGVPSRSIFAYGPGVVLTPASGTAGTVTTVTFRSIQGIGQNATARFYLDDLTSASIGQVTTLSTGRLPSNTTVTIPAGTPAGLHHVIVIDDKARYPIRARFTVN
jgi:hypothetical protein